MRIMQPATLARIFHELLAATTKLGPACGTERSAASANNMAVLPGVLGCQPLRRTVPGTPRNQHPAVARWHTHLRGLATAIRERFGLVLMALLVAMTVSCATPSKQPNSYEECISLCSDVVTRCTRSCYNWNWSAQKSLDCVRNCNQKSEECQQKCSTLQERMPEHYDQGGDLG
jgi:hypothetical protein